MALRARLARSRPCSPKVIGSACCRWVRPAIGVSRCIRASSASVAITSARSASTRASAVAQLQHRRRVHDVLRRRPPMHVAAGFAQFGPKVGAPGRRWDSRRSRCRVFNCALSNAMVGAFCAIACAASVRNHAGFALRHGKRHFGLHIGFELSFVGKHRAHGRRRKHVAIKRCRTWCWPCACFTPR